MSLWIECLLGVQIMGSIPVGVADSFSLSHALAMFITSLFHVSNVIGNLHDNGII